ncbi:hypothetical protein [Actinokineospora inagensis]|uniref:hypothetical protein n=1 Tax=Actinokineospora inagensis TaxID=103730 RepID=UPI0003F86EBA|nr:hypothetical protein [Actinokineospora inagensis]
MTTRETPDWPALEHAYGTAQDIPELLASLRGQEWAEAVDELSASILHQGSVYPATVAAVPFLVDVARDAGSEGRLGALWLLTSYAESIEAGASRSETYLPEGIDIEEFDRDAQAALAAANRGLLSLVDDQDHEVRSAVYGFVAVAPECAEEVRARFDVERDAAVALVEALVRHRKFDERDLDVLLERGDDAVTFAAAWSAVAVGADIPDAVDHLVRLWPDHAEDYPGSGPSIYFLARAGGADAIAALRRLQPGLEVAEAARAWTEIAGASRSSASPAVDGLLALDPRTDDVVTALVQVLPGAPDRTAEVCDAVAGFETPAAAAILFTARDPRWVPVASAVIAGSEPGNDFAYALAGYPAQRRDIEWAAADLLAITAQAIEAWGLATWVDLLALFPPSEAVLRAALPALESAPKAVAQVIARTPSVIPPDLRAHLDSALSAVHPENDSTAGWITAALSNPDFAAAWTLTGEDTNLLNVWAAYPSPSLDAACLALLDGTARTSYPGRQCQLAAARALDDPARSWPTVLAIVNEAGQPLEDAIALARTYDHRDALVTTLRDIADNGRDTWSGPDTRATAIALAALQDLGELPPPEAVDRALATLHSSLTHLTTARTAPTIAAILHTALAADPTLRPTITAALHPLIDTDHRFPTTSETIEDDTTILTALRSVLA